MTTTIFHLMFTFIQIAFQISNGQWTLETSPPLPAPNFRIPIGYNPNTNLVWMVGGPNGANKIVSFNTLTSSYTDYGSISPAIHAPYGKMYTQINNILYFVAGVPVQSYTLYKLDLTNSVPSAQFVSGIPVDWVNYGCIAGGDNYIFVMVGVFAIYNINTNTWTNGPSSTIGSANMAEVTAGGYLYVIGGSASQSSIEKIYVGDISNIFNYNWVQIGSLSSVKRYATSVIYNQYVYVIGGSAVADGSLYYDTVDVIDTSSDTVGLSDSVYEPITDVAPVIVDQRIYAFGGSTAAGLQSYYQHYDIDSLTVAPTGWISPAPTLPPGFSAAQQVGFGAAAWQESVYMIDTQISNSVYRFDPPCEDFTLINSNILPNTFATFANTFTQIGNFLYFLDLSSAPYSMHIYDLSTTQLSANSIPNAPSATNSRACLANDESFIYATGGHYSNTFTYLDLTTEIWHQGQNLNMQRETGGCEVAPNGKLYAIAGYNTGSSIDTIPTANVALDSWTLLSTTFPSPGLSNNIGTVIYGDYIYIGGAFNGANALPIDRMFIIDTSTDTIILSDDKLAYLTWGASPIILNHEFYLFGNRQDSTGKWQKYTLDTPDPTTCSVGVTGDPTSAPSNIPTDSPSRTPTDSPTYKTCDPDELDWDTLNTYGLTQTQLSDPIITSSWDAETLELNVEIVLEYITRSKYTFVDQYDSDRGITYVIDTEPFLSDGRLLSNPNNCENRNAESFIGKDWNTEYWSYLNREDGLNSIDYLEYGPSTDWTLNWDTECETVKYSKSFTFSELLACTDKINENTFVFVDNIVDDIDSLTLEGEFYVTIVSPLINQNNVAYTTDFGQYLTNTIANYPVSISFPKKVASVRDPGVILFDISIFAIQYDEQNSKLLVDILSYSAEYINLINVNVITPTIGYDSNGVVNSITINEDDSYSATECLFETNFRCFQKFQIEIDLSSCPLTSIDLSTTILLDVEPACRNGEDCTLFRSEFGAVGTTTQLTESLSYTESCDTEIYIQTFEGTIKYFTDNEFTNEVDETTEFSIGSTLYVDVSVNDIGAYGVFSINVLNVWICTTSATDLSITSQLTGEGGCIQNYASNNAQASNIDEIYQVFKDGVPYDSRLNGLSTYDSLNDESIRFSLTIPSFQRNKFWLHAIVELKLENNLRRRARLLLTVSHNLGNENNNDGDTNTVNRLSHYIKDVTIVNDVIKTTHGSADTTKQEADSSVSYYSYVMHAICFFTCLFV
eukprot:297051_1